MSKKVAKQSVKLWHVRHNLDASETLYIIADQPGDAAKKALAFIRKRDRRNAQISLLEFKGTIDVF